MLIKLVVVLSLALTAYGSSFDWNKYKKDFNKSYSSPIEENIRKEIFLQNVEKIHKFRQMNTDAKFEIGLNHLADRTYEELRSHRKIIIKRSQRSTENSVSIESLPDSLDWRTKGVVTPVYNQGQVGQVGAFASAEVIETLHAIDTKELVRGSPAFIADCCPQPVDPFTCIAKLGGLCSEGDYPQPTGKCASSKCKPFANFTKIMRLKNHDENMMVSWIQNSSLYVGIDASQISFQMYQSGIYMDNSCDPTQIDHLLQLVGYGKTSEGTIYWICRNSWGSSWGEQGYIRILRGKNVCGIANYVTQIA